LVERLIRNQQVSGSSPEGGSIAFKKPENSRLQIQVRLPPTEEKWTTPFAVVRERRAPGY
jgi:hypothetical protein